MRLIFEAAASAHYGPVFDENRELIPFLDVNGNLYYKISDIEALIYDISGVKDTKNKLDSSLYAKGFFKKAIVLSRLGVSDSRYYKWIRDGLIPAPARNGYISEAVIKDMLAVRDGVNEADKLDRFLAVEDLPDFAK